MENETPDPAETCCLPVFPLPTAVLFPGIVIPLHVDEPCYCQMVEDALAEDRVLGVAMIRADTAQTEQTPLYEVAGAGQIIHAEKLEGGDYNILVQGLDRVRLVEELPPERGYRRFRVEIIPKPSADETDAAKDELLRLERCVMNLVTSLGETDQQLVEVLRSTEDPVQLSEFLAATVVQDVETQQELLQTLDLRARLAKLIDVLVEVLGRSNGAPAGDRDLN
ncbi:MAG: LON peptidase substrate-binding domain-containing protein [Deltaproteobacteria bacterium]|nr:LON peptidase substrate-binding domain-containing protein [Deltaproteobacteria bacterium]